MEPDKRCPKCGYVRGTNETAPDYECPSCGVVYWKYEQILAAREAARKPSAPDPVELPRAPKSFTAGRSLLIAIGAVLAAFAILGALLPPQRTPEPAAKPRPAEKPPAPAAKKPEPPPLTPEEQAARAAERERNRQASDNSLECERLVRAHAKYPDSVDFKWFLGAYGDEWINPTRHLVVREFTAKNAFGMESRHIAKCLFNEHGDRIAFDISDPPPR
jgi:predicted  nucleic acid-binding Zn-ribbon protein